MKKIHVYVMVTGIAVALLFCAGCGSDNPQGSFAGYPTALDVRFVKSSLAEQVTGVLAVDVNR